MKKTAEYRRHAEECRKLAVGAVSKDNRTHLLDIAETWVNLAAAREEMLARYPEMDMPTLENAAALAGAPVTIGAKGAQTSRDA